MSAELDLFYGSIFFVDVRGALGFGPFDLLMGSENGFVKLLTELIAFLLLCLVLQVFVLLTEF